jgi:hypothetical protein
MQKINLYCRGTPFQEAQFLSSSLLEPSKDPLQL